ncbi:oligosaccharide flippase family protein [Vibrio metschnikovii]|nr:oligosaccharide flippase family protein [Vibrio metschnikovii]
MTKNNSILKTGIYGVITKLSVQGAQLIILPIVISQYGNDYFGLLTTLLAMNAASSLVGMGISKQMINEIAKLISDNKDYKNYAWNNFKFFFCISTIIMFGMLAFSIVFFNYNNETLESQKEIINVFILSFSLIILNSFIVDLYRGLQQQAIVAKYQLYSGLLSIALVSIALFMKFDVIYYAIFSMLISPLLSILLSIKNDIFRSILNIDLKVNFRQLKYSKTTFGFFCLGVFQFLSFNLDSLLIVNLLSFDASAAYNLINKFNMLSVTIFSSFSASLWPVLSKLRYDVYGKERTNGLFSKGIMFTTLYVVASFFMLAIVLKFVILNIMRVEIEISNMFYISFAAQNSLVIITSFLIPIFNAYGIIKHQIIFGGLATLTNVSLSLILIPKYGAIGSIWATCIAHFSLCVIPYTYIFLKRVLRDEVYQKYC